MAAEPVAMEKAVSLGHLDGVAFGEIAERFGTPCFVYSAPLVREACRSILKATSQVDARVCYAVKANGNVSLLGLIADEGLGFDVSSLVEGTRVGEAGGRLHDTIMTGPGKSRADIAFAIDNRLAEIVCDSPAELERIGEIAGGRGERVTVGVRVNPAVDAGAHPHLATGEWHSKFGVEPAEALAMFERIASDEWLEPGCVNCHIGSQIASVEPYVEAARLLLGLRSDLAARSVEVARVDLGGGFGVGDASARPGEDVLAGLVSWLSENCAGVPLGFQPGRRVVARAGVLLTRVEYRKRGHVVVDAGMTEMLRPALYGSTHGVAHLGGDPAGPGEFDVVGPVCENADFIAKGVDLDARQGEVVAVFDAGAYSSAMGMEYNGRLRPCEVMVTEGMPVLVRQRQSVADSMRAETGVRGSIA